MELFKIGFITVGLFDILDILIVSFIFYKFWNWLQGSIALRILTGVMVLFALYKLFSLLELQLMTFLVEQFIGTGMIFLAIIFAPEIRRFLILISKNTLFFQFLPEGGASSDTQETINSIVHGVEEIRDDKQGALILLCSGDPLEYIQKSGDKIDSRISARLVSSFFMKDNPFHDGAAIIHNNRIAAVRCVLPLSKRSDLPAQLGLRHRAALGISELESVVAIVVSEERQEISTAFQGKLNLNIDLISLENQLIDFYKIREINDEKKENNNKLINLLTKGKLSELISKSLNKTTEKEN